MQQPLEQPATQPRAPSERATCTAVILAGRLRESALRESLNVHVLCLPVGHAGTLLEAWLAALRTMPGMTHVRVVVNNIEEAAAVRNALPREYRTGGAQPRVEVIPESAAWRGAGGIVRDATEDLADDVVVLVCEGKRLPPSTLDPLFKAMNRNAGANDGVTGGQVQECAASNVAGVVGVCGEDEPAGVYAFTRRVIRTSPRVGYVDLKEQFLPSLAKAGECVVTARLGDDVPHLRDLDSYLETVRHSLLNGNGHSGDQSALRVSARASVSGSAVLDGFCIVEPGAVIEDGAVVHDSVVLWGATIGGGAVVSRSVVGPLTSVEPRARLIRTVAARETPGTSIERAAREGERRWR